MIATEDTDHARHRLEPADEGRVPTDFMTIFERVQGGVMFPYPDRDSRPRHLSVAEQDTVIIPRIPSAIQMIAELGASDVDTFLVRMDHAQCVHCQREGHVTTIRINGRPRLDVHNPLTVAECCRCCAPGLIAQARAELAEDDDRDIHVEVSN